LDRTPSSSCHHQKSSQGDPAPCPSHYSELSGSEGRIAKVSPKINFETTTILTPPVLTQDSSAAAAEPQFLAQVDSGSPPGANFHSTVSILRI
jgi:hypothetical protein